MSDGPGQTEIADAPACAPRTQQQVDTRQLDLLGVFHYVVAGLVFFLSLFPLLYVAFGVLILSSDLPESTASMTPQEREHQQTFVNWFGGLFIAVPALVSIFLGALGVCIVAAGRRLRVRRSYNFCFVITCIECLFFPFGTALGVFSLVVLNRSSVRSLFAS